MIRTYRDVNPELVLRAISSDNLILPDAFAEDSGLAESLRTASDEEKAFGRKVADSARLLRDWCKELDAWKWTGTFETAEFKHAYTTHDTQEVVSTESYSDGGSGADYGTSGRLSLYESRIERIGEELEELDIEQQKSLVLHAHQQPEGSEQNEPTTLPDHAHLDGLTALMTATILTSLPHYSRLLSLQDTWNSRVVVFRIMPGFLADLETAKANLESAWEAVDHSQDGDRDTLVRATFEYIRAGLSGQLAGLGRNLDMMLDALEGRKDTLPDRWIDEVESLEENFTDWIVEAQAEVERNERQDSPNDRTNEESEISKDVMVESNGFTNKLGPATTSARSEIPTTGKPFTTTKSTVADNFPASLSLDQNDLNTDLSDPLVGLGDDATYVPKLHAAHADSTLPEVRESVSFVVGGHTAPAEINVNEAYINALRTPNKVSSAAVEPRVASTEKDLPGADEIPTSAESSTSSTSPKHILNPSTATLSTFSIPNIKTTEDMVIQPTHDDAESALGLAKATEPNTPDTEEVNVEPSQSVDPESDSELTPTQEDWQPRKAGSSAKSAAVVPNVDRLVSDLEAMATARSSETSLLHPHEDTFLIVPVDSRTSHRRNSSHEVIINKASLASRYAMSQVKRIDINKPAVSLHRRRSSDARIPGGQSLTDRSRHKASKSETSSSWSKRNTPSDFPESLPVMDMGSFSNLASSPERETYLDFSSTPVSEPSSATSPNNGHTHHNGLDSHPQTTTAASIDIRPVKKTQDSPVLDSPNTSFFFSDENDDSPGTPLNISRPDTPFSSTDDQLERQIDNILLSLPTRIDFRRKTRKSARQPSLGVTNRSRTVSNGNTSTPPAKYPERSQTPALTLSRADNQHEPRAAKYSRDSSIRLYHLMQTGRSAPIKLYVRLVGEDGERVMVRVGGGWADLAQYLRDYASHHSRAIVPDPTQTLQTMEHDSPGNNRAFSVPAFVEGRKISGASLSPHTSTPPSKPGSRAQSRLGMVPAGGNTLQIPKSRPLQAGSLRSASAQASSSVSALTAKRDSSSENDGESSEEGDSPLLGARARLSDEKRKWLDGMLEKAKKHKAVKEQGAEAGVVGKTKRVYRTSDGSIRALER